LTAGHETTATTLAWLVERVRRPVIDGTSRLTLQRMRLGEGVIPEKHVVIVSIAAAHANRDRFENPSVFDPDRFVGSPPDNYSWIPFGGGIRRCVGAAFANMEMRVMLRTLLREFTFEPTSAQGAAYHSRGIANAPGDGGLAVVHRRATTTPLVDSVGAPATG
jgi:cytochrome P450